MMSAFSAASEKDMTWKPSATARSKEGPGLEPMITFTPESLMQRACADP